MAKNKLAVITGATSGIGAAYARKFAELGYDLIITGRREEILDRFATQLQNEFNINVKHLISEFSDENSFQNFLSELEKIDNIEILINNAGFGTEKNFFDCSYEHNKKMIDVHINAVVRTTHLVIPKILANHGGSIIFVSSLSAYIPLATGILYSSTKAFLVSFAECIHLYLAGSNVKVQVICPGFVNTDFHSKLGETGRMIKTIRFHKWLSPEFVVYKSIKALGKKRSIVFIPGTYYKLLFFIISILPRNVFYKMMINLDKPLMR